MASREMAVWCFDTLLSEMEGRSKPLPRFDVDAGALYADAATVRLSRNA